MAARIPIIEQDSGVQPAIQQASYSPLRSNMSTAETLMSVGDALAKTSRMINHQQEQNGIAWTSAQIGKDQVQWQQAFNDAKTNAKPGADGFTPEFVNSFDTWAEQAKAAAPTDAARKFYTQHLNNLRTSLAGESIAFEAQSQRSNRLDQVSQGIDGTSKAIQNQPTSQNFVQQVATQKALIDEMHVTPDDKLQLQESLNNNSYTGYWLGRIEQNPAGALNDLQSSMKKDGAGDAVIDGTPFKIREQMLNHAEIESNKLGQNMQHQLLIDTSNAESQAQANVAPATRERTLAEFNVAFGKDPAVAKENYDRYIDARRTAEATSNFRNLPSEQLLPILQRAEPDPSRSDFSIAYQNQKVQQQAAATIIKQRQADPWGTAINNQDFNATPISIDQPNFFDKLNERSSALPIMMKKYGMQKPDILSNQESKVLTQQLDSLPAKQRVDTLQKMYTNIGNDDVYKNLIQTIRPDSPVTALVGNVATLGGDIKLDSGSYSKTKVAETMALGEDLLNKSKIDKSSDGKGASFVMPLDADLRTNFMNYAGDAYAGRPDNLERDYQAYRAYYAGVLAQKHGGVNKGESVDSDISKDATIASTGGITKWGSWGSRENTLLPYGMDESEFKDKITSVWTKLAPELGYSKTSVNQIHLMPTGKNGVYLARSGASWIPDKNGNPVMIDVNGAQ